VFSNVNVADWPNDKIKAQGDWLLETSGIRYKEKTGKNSEYKIDRIPSTLNPTP
jgi:hypothetical protein